MELKDFVEKFAEQFIDTDPSEISAEVVYKELDEWDSMMALTIISMVSDEYDTPIDGWDLKNSSTIEDLFNIVKNKKS